MQFQKLEICCKRQQYWQIRMKDFLPLGMNLYCKRLHVKGSGGEN